VLVVVVAFARSSAVAGSKVDASLPDCAEMVIEEVSGIVACQSNSRQAGAVPEGQLPVKSSVNVAGK
jgi:hypothetical protein